MKVDIDKYINNSTPGCEEYSDNEEYYQRPNCKVYFLYYGKEECGECGQKELTYD